MLDVREGPGRWFILAALLVGMVAFANWADRPRRERLDNVEQALAAGGFERADVSPTQSPTNMSRCKVGQMRNRGYAYAWRTEEARGVFCLPIDGRPSHIIVDAS